MTTVPAEAFFLKPGPRTLTRSAVPEIVWEVPPPDFEIPDEPMDNEDQSLLADAIRDALSCAGLISRTRLSVTSIALCAKVDGKTITKAPDWFYVPTVKPAEHRRGYTPVVEGGLPAVVMEFLSDSEGREYDDSPVYPYGKWYYYEKIIKIPWYVIFDAESGKLEVYRLVKGRYQQQSGDKNKRYWIDSMQLFLGVWPGLKEDMDREIFWLRWWDKHGNLLPWQYERRHRENTEKQAALEKAERENQAIKCEKQIIEHERQAALERAELAERERREALERAEREKREALERAEREKRNILVTTAQKMLQAQMDIAVIAQVTGLNETDIAALKPDKEL